MVPSRSCREAHAGSLPPPALCGRCCDQAAHPASSLPTETASDLNGNQEGHFGWLTALNIMLGNEPFRWVNCFHFLVWLSCWMGIREAKGGLFIQKEKGLSWSFGGWWKSRVGSQGLPQATSRSENLMAFPNSKSLERLGSFLIWTDVSTQMKQGLTTSFVRSLSTTFRTF